LHVYRRDSTTYNGSLLRSRATWTNVIADFGGIIMGPEAVALIHHILSTDTTGLTWSTLQRPVSAKIIQDLAPVRRLLPHIDYEQKYRHCTTHDQTFTRRMRKMFPGIGPRTVNMLQLDLEIMFHPFKKRFTLLTTAHLSKLAQRILTFRYMEYETMYRDKDPSGQYTTHQSPSDCYVFFDATHRGSERRTNV
jgi:hypothetical protein